VVEDFRTWLESYDGRLHEAGSLEDARAKARELIGGATVARWADEPLDGIAEKEAPAAEAEVSLIHADVAVAGTGAIGCFHGAGRGRAVGLLPPRQIALVRASDLVPEMSDAVARFFTSGSTPPPNVVFISGPSRTSDIEQRSIRGMHAPGELDVILYGA
jgi:L-lactate utilization protein LutC